MTSKYIILLLIFLFIIYCYRKPINRIIESFYSEDSSDDSTRNLLPPIASERVSDSGDFEINVPFRNAVGGTMTYDPDGDYLVQTTDTSRKCYTNHFMFTPLAKTKKIIEVGSENNLQLDQRTFVLSAECVYTDPEDITSEAEVELWIFGLNKGRRHFVDQSYQDFMSIIKKVPNSTYPTKIEIKYKPLNVNTEYVAIRLDNNTPNKSVKWKNIQLEEYNESEGIDRRPDLLYATPFTSGSNLYKYASSASASYTECNALTVNKFSNNEDSGRYSEGDRFINRTLNFSEPDDSGNIHYCNKKINSYFPSISNEIDISEHKHFEKYIKLTLNFQIQNSSSLQEGALMSNIINLFQTLEKHFTYTNDNNLIDNSNDFYKNNLFGFLKKQYYNNNDRINITDITFSNDTVTDGTIKYSKLRIGNFRFKNVSNNNLNFIHVPSNKSSGPNVKSNFDYMTGTGSSVSEKHKIVIPINIYYDSPRHVDDNLSNLKTDIKNFMSRPLDGISYISLNAEDNSKSISDIDLVADKLFQDGTRETTPSYNTNHCSTYPGTQSQCTAMATEVSGVGSQIQECSCTRCSTSDNIRGFIKSEATEGSLKPIVDTNIVLYPGHGNPFYFCNRAKENCNGRPQDECTGNCEWNSSNLSCGSVCNFKFPPNYNDPDSSPEHSLKINDSYDRFNPYVPNKEPIGAKDNSCQIYNDDDVLKKTKINMNYFRNATTRFNTSGNPIDLCLNIGQQLNSTGAGIEDSIFVSKYRGERIFWYKKGPNTYVPMLMGREINNIYFLNIDQFNLDSGAFRNLSSQTLDTFVDSSGAGDQYVNIRFEKITSNEESSTISNIVDNNFASHYFN